MSASLPHVLSVIANTHHDLAHPAKAQAVAAELNVWKSWRGMRSSQRGESEKQVGKGVLAKQGSQNPFERKLDK